MTTLEDNLRRLRTDNRKGLIIYVTAGCPDYETTYQAVLAAAVAGADVVEIGIPFSDPMADGPIIQKAAAMALKAGATTVKTLELVKKLRTSTAVSLVVMTYVNTILRYGIDKFIHDFKQAGLDGLIVPDLPLEECGLLENACKEAGLSLVQFVAPTSPEERIPEICQKANGFIYCISSTGVTGVREIDYQPIGQVIGKVRQYTDVPTAIGFGIGSPEAAVNAARYADAVIVGSAVMQRLMDEGVESVGKFVKTLGAALEVKA